MKNREIKFRAWNKKEKRMYSNAYLLMSNETWSLRREDDGESFDVKLMQYTGLKDRNGKEVYEGDIVECMSFKIDGKDSKTEVEEIKWGWVGGYDFSGVGFNIPDTLKDGWLKVIGNIYENPELLKP